MANNRIQYQIGFKTNTSGIQPARKALLELQKMTQGQFVNIKPEVETGKMAQALQNIKKEAGNVEEALLKAFNPKLNTVNTTEFFKILQNNGNSSIKDMNSLYSAFSQAGAKGQAAFRGVSTSIFRTNSNLKESHKLLDKMGQTLGNTIKWNISSGAVNALSRGIQQAWGYAKSLDRSLNDIRIVTGKSADEMARFAETANNAAKNLGKSTTDYTNAALIYAQQGLSDEEIQKRTEITLKTANVTGQSTDAVSEELTAVWNGYKVNANQAELYIDRLAAVAATTASDLEELSTGMSKVASAAAAMGVGEDQLAAQLSTIISVTRQAPETVGTALRTIYARISDIKAGIDEDGVTLGNYSGKMAELGFNVLDASGNLRDMGSVMEDIGNRWQTLTREQQVSLAQTMAGQRQYSNLIALFDNFEKYNESLHVAQTAAGTLQKQQDIYMESTAAHLNNLKTSVQDVYDSLINPQGLNPLIDGLSQIATLGASAIDSIGGGGAVLKSLGAIGMQVFSGQIAKGLATTARNAQAAKLQIADVQSKIQLLETAQKDGTGNDTTDRVLQMERQLLNLNGQVDNETYQKMQDNIDAYQKAASTVDVLNGKFKILQDELKAIGIETNTFDDVVAEINSDSIEQMRQRLLGVKKAIETAVSSDSFKQLKNQMGQNYAQATKGSRKKLQENIPEYAKNAISQLTGFKESLTDGSSEIDQGMSQITKKVDASVAALNEKLKTVKWKNLGAKDLKIEANEIRTIINQALNSYTEYIKSLENTLARLNKNSEDYKKIQEELNKARAQADILGGKDGNKGAIQAGFDLQEQEQRYQGYVNLASGMMQVVQATTQLQNLGSIWTNDDISSAEKFTQTITGLGMSIPMVINGISLFKNALVDLKLAEPSTVAAMGPWIIGITAAVAAIGLVVNAINGQHQARLKQQAQIIDDANAKQEQIEKNKELYDSIDDLNKQYEQGQISRTDLKSSIQDLIKEYGLEEDAAKKLRQEYNNLNQARKEAAETAAASADEENKAAQKEMMQQARGYLFDNGFKTPSGGYRLSLGDMGGASSSIITDFSKIRGAQTSTQIIRGNQKVATYGRIDLENLDVDSLLQTYDAMDALFQKIQTAKEGSEYYLSEQEKNTNKWYQNTEKWLQDMRQSVEKYRASLEDLNKYSVQLLSFNDNINFDNVDNAEEFLKKRQEFIDKVVNSKDIKLSDGVTGEDLVDSFLRENYSDIQIQYGQISAFLDKMKQQIGDTNDTFANHEKEITSILGSLSDAQVAAIANLDFSHIKDWQNFEEVLKRISGIDFSNVENLTNPADQYNAAQKVIEELQKEGTVSQKTYDALIKLQPELASLFRQTYDGSYVAREGIVSLKKEIEDFSMQGWEQEVKRAYDSLANYDLAQVFKEKNKITDENVDEKMFGSAVVSETQDSDGNKISKVDSVKMDRQYEYLKSIRETNEELNAQLMIYEQQNEKLQHNVETADMLSELMTQYGDPLKNTKDELNQKAQDALQALSDMRDKLDQDVDSDEYQRLTDTLVKYGDSIKGVSKDLQENEDIAEDVAQALLRFDDAVKDVKDNYNDWMKALTSGSVGDQAQAISELRDAYADLLDFPEDAFSEQFLTSADNLQLLKEAANGSEEAYDQLAQAAQQDIAAQVGLDTTKFDAGFDHLMDMYYQGKDIDDMEIGASLNDQGFLDGLTQMVNAANMNADQATAYLSSMGVDAQVIQQDTEAEQLTEQKGFKARWTSSTAPFSAPIPTGDNNFTMSKGLSYLAQNLSYEPDPVSSISKKQNKSFALKVTSAHKSTGGSFKFKNAPTRKSGASKGSGGGGRSGGGGGGGGSSKPNTSTKEAKKPVQNQKDIYHDINIQLKQINRQLDRMKDKQDYLWGKDLLDNLNKQTSLLEKQKKKLLQKQKIQQQDLKDQQATLKNLGVTFDKYGNISNYMAIIDAKQQALNKYTAEYNELVKKYNATTDADLKASLEQSMKLVEANIKDAEEDLNNTKTKIGNYDKLRQDIEDLKDEVTELTNKQIELNIKKFEVKVQLKLDLSEAEREFNDFMRNVVQRSDVLKGDTANDLLLNAKRGLANLTTYFTTAGGQPGPLKVETDAANFIMKQIESIDKTGTSSVYGNNKSKAMEDLKAHTDNIKKMLGEVKDAMDEVFQAYLDTIDDVNDKFEEQFDNYDLMNQLIEHNVDLVGLVYGDKNYGLMNTYYQQLRDNQFKQIDLARQTADFWKERLDQAKKNHPEDTALIKAFTENWKNAIKRLNSYVEQSVKTIKEKYTNAIKSIFEEEEKLLTGGHGYDYFELEWDLINKNADRYLDPINSAFAMQDLQRQFQDAMNNADGLKAQKALKKVYDEQVKVLKQKEKISQYDIDRAQKLLAVQQARIALEEAQRNKTSMRLKRDSQGNYSYEYVADEANISQAQGNLAKAQNDVWNLDNDRWKEINEQSLSIMKDFAQKRLQILNDESLTAQQKQERLALLFQQNQQHMTDLQRDAAAVRGNLIDSAVLNNSKLYGINTENFDKMTKEEQDLIMKDLVPTWNTGITEMLDKAAGEDGLFPVYQDSLEKANKATDQLTEDMDKLNDVSGNALENMKNGTDENIEKTQECIVKTDELIATLGRELDASKNLTDQTRALAEEYDHVGKSAEQAVSHVYRFVQAQTAAAAAYNQTAKAYDNGIQRIEQAQNRQFNNTRQLISELSSLGGGGGGSSSTTGSSSSPSSFRSTPSSHSTTARTNYSDTTSKHSQNYFGDGEYWRRRYNGVQKFASGGYTGEWNSDQGKIAILHEKELVLNQQDTQNILDTISILRGLTQTTGLSIQDKLSLMSSGMYQYQKNLDKIEQNVHIEASFPNVNSKREIEEAFSELVNLAAQRVLIN